MKRLWLILPVISLVFPQPDTVWTQTFGGSDWDVGYSVQQTTDGGYIITGETYSFGNGAGDVWLIKTDSQGNEEWNQTFGGSSSDYGRSVQQTTDGGYIITGKTLSYGNGGNDVWLIKTNSHGDSLWTKTYGGSDNDWGYSVQQTTDGGYIVTGFTRLNGNGGTDVWLIKTDSNGDSLWTKTYGGSSNDYGRSVQQTTDGGYIITGSTSSLGNGDNDVWLIKTDSQGNEEWNQTFGGSSSDYGRSVQQTTDGGYVITGYYEGGNLLVLKTDYEGYVGWNYIYSGGSGGKSILQLNNGSYIVLSGVTVNGQDIYLSNVSNPSTITIDSIFNQITNEDTQIIINLPVEHIYDYPLTVTVTSDTIFVLTYLDSSTLYLTPVLDWSGNSLITVIASDSFNNSDTTTFTLTVNPVNDSPEPFTGIYPTVSDTFSTHTDSNTDIAFTWGASYDVDGDVTYTLTIELDFFGVPYTDIHENISDTTISVSSNTLDALLGGLNQTESTLSWYVDASDEEYTVRSASGQFVLVRAALSVEDETIIPEEFALHQNYPNPFNPVTTLRYDLPENSLVTITIYDMLGRVVNALVQESQTAGYKSVIWNATNSNGKPVSAGIYLYQIQAGEYLQTKKMVLLK